MKVNSRNFRVSTFLMILATLGILAAIASAQDKHKAEYKEKSHEFCTNNNYSSGDRVSFSEVREMTLPATGSVNVDGGQNGGVRVKGEDRSDVLVRACIQTWGKTDEAAKAAAADIKIGTGGTIKAESSSGEKDWSVSYEVSVPRNTDLNLKAHNGGISIGDVEGILEFETMNGGVSLKDVAGDVKGRTTNGGVMVSLSGSNWKGTGLDVETTNGGVVLSIAENYAAHIETGTVNGGLRSDIPSLNITTEEVRGDWTERTKAKRISTNLNGGGAPIRVITTNGGVQINSSENSGKNW